MAAAKAGQAEVVLVGCGAPNRGMGWYHAIQMLEGRYVFVHHHNLNFYTYTLRVFIYMCIRILVCEVVVF
jgi:hypothetical protein